MKTAEQLAQYVANAKAKRHAKALAEGRVPGKVGTPKRLVTEELREEARIRNNKRKSKLSLKIRTAKRAAKAIADGRTPGMPGPKAFTPEQLTESTKQAQKRYREKNIDRINDRDKKKKQEMRATPEGREYLRKIALINSGNRRAWKKGATGKFTALDIMDLYKEQDGKCGLCQEMLGDGKTHIDHWIPLCKGGSNEKDNLRLLHAKCNLQKQAKHPNELLKRSA